MAIESPLQRFIVDYLKKIGASQRKFGDAMDLSETTFGTYKRMTSAMGLDTLDKILTVYPGVKQALIDYLRTNTDEKPTSEVKDKNSPKDPQLSEAELLDLYRNAYFNVKADVEVKTKKISELEARIAELEDLLNEEKKKKVAKGNG